MKSRRTSRLIALIMCGISCWSAVVVAIANEEKAGNIVMLWPKDAAGQNTNGMGTPKPDRGDGHIRLTDITTPSLRYFPGAGRGQVIILATIAFFIRFMVRSPAAIRSPISFASRLT